MKKIRTSYIKYGLINFDPLLLKMESNKKNESSVMTTTTTNKVGGDDFNPDKIEANLNFGMATAK